MLIFLKESLKLFGCRLNSLHLRKMRKLGHNKTVFLITAGLMFFAAAFFYTYTGEAERTQAGVSPAVKVEETWKLPSILKEVSGIAFLAPNKIACVQDERGSIFIYNLKTSKIEQEIKFAGKGDFEGLAVNRETAYVLESNGTLYEIRDFLGTVSVKKAETFFTSKNNLEGLFYEKTKNRLLLAVKGDDPQSKDEKNIYAVQLPSLEMLEKPIYKLTFEEEIFDDIRKEDRGDSFYPSEVAVDPSTGKIFVLEAREPKLLILNASGVPEKLHRLDPEYFPQPEGMTFDSSGNFYISNEGNPATIHRVTLSQE